VVAGFVNDLVDKLVVVVSMDRLMEGLVGKLSVDWVVDGFAIASEWLMDGLLVV